MFACKASDTFAAQITKVLSLISSSCMPFVQIWIPTIDLDQVDKDVIMNGGLFCDKQMNAASKLISQLFPAVQGINAKYPP